MITSYFIRKKIRKLAAEERQKSRRSLPFDQVKSVLVLYNAVDHEALREGFKMLKAAHKQLHTCLFVESEALAEEVKKSASVVEKKLLSAWGFPSEEVVSQLASIPVDLLIDLTQPGCYPMQYVALRHPSTFKVGVKYPEQEWYDMGLLVAERNDIAYLFEQILFYLRTIHA